MARCFIARMLPGPALERLRAEHQVEVWPGRLPPTPGELRAKAADAEGLITLLTDRVDAGMLEHAPHLRAIANYAVGYDNIDLAAAHARGIAVGNTPDVLTEATADLTFALMLAAARRLPEALADVRSGEWMTWEPGRKLGRDVHGATLGIIGLGRIGRAVARRAQGFGMTVIHTGGRPAAGAEGSGGGQERGARRGEREIRSEPVTLDELLARADYVSLHCPLTSKTHHLVDAAAVAKMRNSTILINTARGPIVDQQALRSALIEGKIAGAALDVTDPEPLRADDPLLEAPNLIVAPHIGSATERTRQRMADIAVENLLAALAGRPMPHPVSTAPASAD